MALILVVDDSSFARKLTSGMVTDLGHEAVQAEDGEQCLKLLSEKKPECIIMDLLMPGKNGKEILEEIRSSGNNVPVIIQTADVQESVLKSCVDSGADGVVTKPFDSEKLSTKLSEVLARS